MDLYAQLAEISTAEVDPAHRRFGTYETKTVETVDEDRAGALLGSLAL
jgi:hypothetical protein